MPLMRHKPSNAALTHIIEQAGNAKRREGQVLEPFGPVYIRHSKGHLIDYWVAPWYELKGTSK